MLHLTDHPIDTTRLIDQACSPAAGAVVVFLGITRQFTESRESVLDDAAEWVQGIALADGAEVDRVENESLENGTRRETVELHYDAYREMAELEIARLVTEARRRWSLVECLIVHRLGAVPLAEVSVAIVVSSAHRRAALNAGQWLIDTLKEHVPIWKKECWADGQSALVHPD